MAGRFRFSFPPRRHQDDPWFRIGNLDVTTTVLVALLSLVTIVLYGAKREVLLRFVLWPDKVWSGQVWRLVTWPMVTDGNILWGIVSIAIFWWFGRELEAQVGRIRFALLLAAVTIGSGLVAAGLDVGLVGLRYVELAVFVLFVAENPRVPFFFGIRGWIIAAVFVGAEILQRLGNRQFEELWVTLVSLAIVLLVGRSFGLAADQAWIPNLGRAASVQRTRGAVAARRKAPKQARRASGNPVVAGPWAPPNPTAATDQAEVDRLLDKISSQGIDALSAVEKQRLKEASERLRRERG
jgi:hypothetical protein